MSSKIINWQLHNSFLQSSNRRGSEAGRQNFRSKRFSRNLKDKEPSHFKAQVRASRTEYSDFNEVSIKIDHNACKKVGVSQRVGASHEQEGSPNDGDRGEETLPIHVGHGEQRRRHQSMEDLSLQESTGIELARLLRVRIASSVLGMQLISPQLEMRT